MSGKSRTPFKYQIMKKITLILVTLFVFGCKPTEKAVETKLNYQSQVAVKGDWQVTDVSYANSDYIKVSLFDLGNTKCFVNSTWHFISNNNKGNMKINDYSCAYESDITWYINQNNEMVIKFLNGTKSKKVTTGYVVQYVPINENKFQLIEQADVLNKTQDIVLTFERI